MITRDNEAQEGAGFIGHNKALSVCRLVNVEVILLKLKVQGGPKKMTPGEIWL